MSKDDIIIKQASIIEQMAEVNGKYSNITRTALSLLSQYTTVEAEERKIKELDERREG